MSATRNPALGNAQLRVLDVIEALAGHEVFGLRLKDVATAVKTPLLTDTESGSCVVLKTWTCDARPQQSSIRSAVRPKRRGSTTSVRLGPPGAPRRASRSTRKASVPARAS